MPVYQDNTKSIGHTPLIRINRLDASSGATILAKIEGRNPAYSVKCRIGAAMVWDAEETRHVETRNVHRRGHQRQHGHRPGLCRGVTRLRLRSDMPETMSMERRKVLVAFGAKLVLTPGAKGHEGRDCQGRGVGRGRSGQVCAHEAVRNPANPAIHEKTTGPEIWDDTEGKVDVFVSGVGTGGTLTGVSRYIKGTRGKKILTVAVEPVNSPVITQTLASQPLTPTPHKIQGIGAGFIPRTWTCR